MDRKLRTKRGRALYRQRGAAIEPEFGQMKDRQGADRFSMRSLARAAAASGSRSVHNLHKLRRGRAKNQGTGGAKAKKMA